MLESTIDDELDSELFQGLWYVIGRYKNYMEMPHDYSTIEFKYNQVTNTFSIECLFYADEKVILKVYGVGYSKGDGEIEIRMADERFQTFEVLYTDYNECTLIRNRSLSIIMCRERYPLDMDKIRKIAIDYGFEIRELEMVKNKN